MAVADIRTILNLYLRSIYVDGEQYVGSLGPHHTFGQMLRSEMDEVTKAMDSDTQFPRSNWPRFMLEFGAEFAISATLSAVRSKPEWAVLEIEAAFNEIRSAIHERVAESERMKYDAQNNRTARSEHSRRNRRKKTARSARSLGAL